MLALSPQRLDDIARLAAVRAFAALPEAASLAAANKRIANILKKARRRRRTGHAALLVEPAEGALCAHERRRRRAAERCRGRLHGAAAALAALREPVDTFFNDVMVNAEDPALRANRLALLGGCTADELRRRHFATRRLKPAPRRCRTEEAPCNPESGDPRPRRRDQRPPKRPSSRRTNGCHARFLEAIARLNQAGYRVAIATNQSGIGRGLFDIAALNAMHWKMQRWRRRGGRIEAVFFCPHTAPISASAASRSPAC